MDEEMKMTTKADGHDHQGAGKSEPVVGRMTVLLALAGLVIGGAAGWVIGRSFGSGRFGIAGLAPLVAGGAGVTGFIFASFFGSLLGLAGAVFGALKETPRKTGRKPDRTKHKKAGHGRSSFIERLPIFGAIALALFMAYTLYVIASRALGSGSPSDQSNRVTWNQKNAARVGGAGDAETAQLVLQTAFPATRAGNSPRMIISVKDDWRAALAATPLIARPTGAALLIAGANGPDDSAAREIERLRAPSAGAPSPSPSPSPSASPNARAAAMPTPPPPATQPSPAASPSPETTAAQPKMLSVGVAPEEGGDEIAENDPAVIAALVDERLASETGSRSANVIIVSADSDYRWALPAGAYAARTGTPVLFVDKTGVPNATIAALQRRQNRARVFVLGPEAAVPVNVFERLRQFGTLTRIEGGNYFENAVRFAEFRDDTADFGWGRTGAGSRKWSPTNTILVGGDRWQDGVMAAHLARGGKSGALLFTERDRVPPIVDNYLWRQRPAFGATPAEGPFNHVWVVGSFNRVAYGAQAWADYSQEIEQYMTLGDSAVSGYEALGMGWLFFSIAAAVWIVFHSARRLPDVMPVMKAAWAIFALLLGPIALWLYVVSYHRREKMEMEGMVMWQRPLWLQTVSATVMMFAFDMMLMCLAVFLVAYFGFPLIRFNGPLYWLGTSMFLMMVLMYLIALIVMMLVFHTPMTMHERKVKSYWKAFLVGAPIMLLTMTVESLGMMPTMWWQQMIFLPAMQMPTSDDFTMWTTLLYSVFIGFLVVLPFNYWMVRRGTKMGTM